MPSTAAEPRAWSASPISRCLVEPPPPSWNSRVSEIRVPSQTHRSAECPGIRDLGQSHGSTRSTFVSVARAARELFCESLNPPRDSWFGQESTRDISPDRRPSWLRTSIALFASSTSSMPGRCSSTSGPGVLSPRRRVLHKFTNLVRLGAWYTEDRSRENDPHGCLPTTSATVTELVATTVIPSSHVTS